MVLSVESANKGWVFKSYSYIVKSYTAKRSLVTKNDENHRKENMGGFDGLGTAKIHEIPFFFRAVQVELKYINSEIKIPMSYKVMKVTTGQTKFGGNSNIFVVIGHGMTHISLY